MTFTHNCIDETLVVLKWHYILPEWPKRISHNTVCVTSLCWYLIILVSPNKDFNQFIFSILILRSLHGPGLYFTQITGIELTTDTQPDRSRS